MLQMTTIAAFQNKRLLDQFRTRTNARKSRLESGKAQKDMAKSMGISAAYLSDLEAGRRDWSEELIEKFDKAIGEE